jgi:ATP-binding cassette subfamily B protein
VSVADDILPARTYDARLMRRLLVYLRPHVVAIALAGAAILVSSLVDLAQPWLTQQAIDKYIASGDAPGLARMAVFFFVLIVVGFLAEYGQTFILQTTGQRIMHRMRTEVYAIGIPSDG